MLRSSEHTQGVPLSNTSPLSQWNANRVSTVPQTRKTKAVAVSNIEVLSAERLTSSFWFLDVPSAGGMNELWGLNSLTPSNKHQHPFIVARSFIADLNWPRGQSELRWCRKIKVSRMQDGNHNNQLRVAACRCVSLRDLWGIEWKDIPTPDSTKIKNPHKESCLGSIPTRRLLESRRQFRHSGTFKKNN